MTENQFEIVIRIQEESELYNSFDPSRRTLSSDLGEYIISCLKDSSIGDKPLLHIVSDTEIDLEQFHKALDHYSERQMTEFEKSRKSNRYHALRMCCIGVFFIVVGIVFNGSLGAVPTTVIETLGSFSIWEAADIWLQELPRLRISQKIANYLRDPEVTADVKM